MPRIDVWARDWRICTMQEATMMVRFAEMGGKASESDEEGWPFAVDPSTLHREDPMFMQARTHLFVAWLSAPS